MRGEKTKTKCDPKLIAAARELRDRYLDAVNSGRYVLEAALPGGGKYDVTRALAAPVPPEPPEVVRLPAAA